MAPKQPAIIASCIHDGPCVTQPLFRSSPSNSLTSWNDLLPPPTPLHSTAHRPLQAHNLAISRFSSLLSSSDSQLPHIYAAMTVLLSPLASAAATARKAAGRGVRGEGAAGTGPWRGSEEESEEERRRMGAAVATELDALAAWKGGCTAVSL